MGKSRHNTAVAKRQKMDGYSFDSIAETKRYFDLKMMQRIGEIENLEVHPKFPLHINDAPLITPDGTQIVMEADFAYDVIKDGSHVVEDVKGYKNKGTTEYRLFALKRAIVLISYGIDIQIIFR